MPDFKLKDNEEIKLIKENILIKANTNEFILTLFITNYRLILFKDINKDLLYNTFLSSRLVSIPKNNEMVFSSSLKDLKSVRYENSRNILIFKDHKKLTIYGEDLRHYLS